MDTLTDAEGNIVTADTEQIELLLGQQISGAGEQISVHLGTESIGSAPYDHLPELPGSGIHGDEDMQEEEEGGDGSGVSSGQSSGVVTQLHIGEVDEVDEVDDDEVMQAMHEHIKQEQEETTTMSINLSASGLDPNAAGVMQITPDGQVLFTPNNPDDSSPVQTQVTSLQTIRLADGTTAFLQQNTKDAANFQAVELEDGTTALVSAGSVAMPQKQAESVINAKFLEGQTVQLEDGTTAFIQAAHPKTNQSLQVQLEDGSTAYLPANLFENGQLDPNEIIQQQQQQHTEDEIQEAASSYQPKVLPSRPPSHRALALGEKAYRCTYDGCGRLYTTQHHLKIHERSHTGDKPFKCEMEDCSRAFATSYGLKSHIRVHTGEKPYKCPMDECPKAFKTSGDLQKHVRTHTGEKPFKCPFEGCNQAFTTSNIRKVHIRTHTGERPFICDYKDCKKSFASATNYKNHMRIHSGEKPYVCTVLGCGKRFTEYSSLYKHHVVHTHNKPYECGHCGKTYRQTSTLAMHRRTAHNDDGTGDEQQHVTTIDVITAFDGAGMVESKDHCNENEDGDSLVINTDNGKQKTTKLTVLTSGGMTGTTTSSTMTPLTLHNSGGGTLALTDLHGQQILVVTDPAQLDMIQQLTQHANLVIQNDPATSSAPMEISKTDDASTDHCTNFLNTE